MSESHYEQVTEQIELVMQGTTVIISGNKAKSLIVLL